MVGSHTPIFERLIPRLEPATYHIGLIALAIAPRCDTTSERNKVNRSKQSLPHTARSKSFASIREEEVGIFVEDEYETCLPRLLESYKSINHSTFQCMVQRVRTQTSPTRANMWIKTHVHKDGSTVNSEAADVMGRIKDIISRREGTQDSLQDSPSPTDVLSQVLGGEKPSHVRGYDLGMIATRLWGSSSSHGGPSATNFTAIKDQLKKKEEQMSR